MTQFVFRFYFMFLLLMALVCYVLAWVSVVHHAYPTALFFVFFAGLCWFFVWSDSAEPLRRA